MSVFKILFLYFFQYPEFIQLFCILQFTVILYYIYYVILNYISNLNENILVCIQYIAFHMAYLEHNL